VRALQIPSATESQVSQGNVQAGEEETEAITLGGFATLCLLNFTQMSLCSI